MTQSTKTETETKSRAPRRLTLTRETLRNVRGGDGTLLWYASKSTPTLITG